jgi:hypothetical protein
MESVFMSGIKLMDKCSRLNKVHMKPAAQFFQALCFSF